jgi:hypothetical protein
LWNWEKEGNEQVFYSGQFFKPFLYFKKNISVSGDYLEIEQIKKAMCKTLPSLLLVKERSELFIEAFFQFFNIHIFDYRLGTQLFDFNNSGSLTLSLSS